MTNDLLNQIRAARAEAEAIAGSSMTPSAMRHAVAALAGHLAELEADAEAEQDKDLERQRAQAADRLERSIADRLERQAAIERQAAAEGRTVTRACDLLRWIDTAEAAAGASAKSAVAAVARRELGTAIKRRRWGKEPGDDYDMAGHAWTAIFAIEADRLKALVAGMVLDAVGAELEILPKGARREDVARKLRERMANLSFGGEVARQYDRLRDLNKARAEERTAAAETITTAAEAVTATAETITTAAKTITTAAGVVDNTAQAVKRTGKEKITQIEALAIMQKVHDSIYDDDDSKPEWSLTVRTLSNWKHGIGTPRGFTLSCCAADFANWARTYYGERRARKTLRNPYRTGTSDFVKAEE